MKNLRARVRLLVEMQFLMAEVLTFGMYDNCQGKDLKEVPMEVKI